MEKPFDFTALRHAGLAPMAGVTDAPMRLLCHEQGAAWAVSEMLSAKGWILSRGKNETACALLERLPGEGIVGLQLFGREPDYMAAAAADLQDRGFDYIDINFGCPAPKIAGNGEGSALMKEPELLGRIVRAVADATYLPVSAKIRSGWSSESINAPEIAKICEGNGAKAITVHGRTRNQQYSGRADRGIIAQVKKAVQIPVFGNGDIRSGTDALSMIEETDCDAVLVGRGAQGNPWVFREVEAAIEGKPYSSPTPNERVQMALRHFQLETELHGERRGLFEMRKHIAWYVNGLKGASVFRARINTLPEAAQVREALCEFLSTQE